MKTPEEQADRARRWSIFWWAQAPIVCGAFLVLSSEPMPERLMLAYLAFVSIAAMAVTYSGKAKAADAQAEART